MEIDLLKSKIELNKNLLKVEKDSFTNASEPSWSRKFIKSAVLVGFTTDNDSNRAQIILTRRVDHLENHSSEISLPGGKMEQGESSRITAKRESEEEIGLERKFVQISHSLPNCYTATGYCVTPVIGFVDRQATYQINTKEVSKLHRLYLTDFLDKSNVSFVSRNKFYNHNGYDKNIIYTIDDENEQLIIWGVTAAIINKLIQVIA